VRAKLGLDQLEPLSPWRLADAIPAHIFYPEDFGDGSLARRMRRVKWDEFASYCPGDPTLMMALWRLDRRSARVASTARLVDEEKSRPTHCS
jgi:hypothetical protein